MESMSGRLSFPRKKSRIRGVSLMQVARVIEHITGWLSDYIEASGMKGFVIGVSGGIDSAVTSTLGA
ncbi:MAG: hypothetical protein ABW149_04870, partial [Sedimenticola sp.]